MLVSNHQKNVNYYKQFPCYSITTHMSQHRELEFANVTCVQFTRKTSLRQQLPKYFIDKYQTPNVMYWLQWQTEQLQESVIAEGRKRQALKCQASNNTTNTSTLSQQSQNKKPYRCLYISQLGKIAHIKLVFNYDPETIGICQDYIYTIGGNQLIITQLWPKAVNINKRNINSTGEQLPSKQSQVIHQLQSGSQVMSLDFVVLQDAIVAKVIYFNDKKGFYAKAYSKDQEGSNSMQIINKIIDLTFSFKKNQQKPLLYQTLVPNIIGIVVHNTKQFSLMDLTQMKLIQNARMSLTEWQLDINQVILIKSHQNKAHEGYNDCLTISIGQGSNVEIFLYHIRFITSAHIVQQSNKRIQACEQERPICFFTSSQFIQFSQCKLKHFSIINMQKVTSLTNYILTKNGIIYLGYHKGCTSSFDLPASEQLPISGFVDYMSPFMTHQILMQENKIWKEYKFDMLFHNVFSIVKDKYKMGGNETALQRILTPGRYEKWFIAKILGVDNISEIKKMQDLENEDTFASICQKLAFEWRNQYKFVQFVIYKQQVLVIRKNSIGSLVQIPQQQFSLQKDKLSQPQISYNQILSRGFSARYDIEGDAYMDEQFNINQHRNESNADMSHAIFRNCRTYEEKLRSIDMMVGNYMEEGWFENGLTKEVNLARVGNDQQEMRGYSKAYESKMSKVLYLAKMESLQSLPESLSQSIQMGQMSVQMPIGQMLSQQSQLLLHLQVLCLKVKDQLYYLSNSLKANYQYHFNQLLSQLQNSAQNKKQSPPIVTMQLLQKTHLQHLYVVFILQWLCNIGSKSYLQSQYEYFNRDLIEQFIEQYVYKFTSQSLSADDQTSKKNGQQKSRYWRSTRQLFKSDLSIHVNNVISLMLKGLLCEFNYQPHHMNVSQLIDEDIYSEGKLVVQHIKELNAKMNPFIFMLLNKQQFIKTASLFIADGLIMQLFEQLILNPIHQNLAKFMPINKTFVYSILNLPLSRQRKIGLLSSYLESKQFQTLMLLIQCQNNCYMTLHQDNELCIGYEGLYDKFCENSLRLSRQNCCIIEELIVQNYKSFLLPSSQILLQPSSGMPIRSQISSPEYLNYVTSYKQQRYRQFTKILFSNIQFEYLTQAGHHNRRKQNQRMNEGEMNEQNGMKSVYDSKALVESHRLKIQEIQEINQSYWGYTQSKIQKTFSKFYSKIFKSNNKQEQSGLKRLSNGQQNAIKVESNHISLSQWQLDRINKLYLKHSRNLRLQRKSSFEGTSIIQKKLNLEYAMMKIYLFRLKFAFNEITKLEENEKENYVQIMKQCVEKIKDAIVAFKDNVAKLGGGNQITDQNFLQMIKQIDIMQHSKVWDKDADSLESQAQTNPESIRADLNKKDQKWKILNLPISSEWLNLLSLTFYQSPNMAKSFVFTNYDNLQSIIMKILIVAKEQNMDVEFESLRKLFGQKEIDKIIKGNQELRKLYQVSQGAGGNTSKLSAQTSSTFIKKQPLRSNQSAGFFDGLKIKVIRR